MPGLRPTSERIRETLFNWLAPALAGARCLDLFAGTGALGLEALSRGAAEGVFVENSAAAAKVLRANIKELAATGAIVHQADALQFLKSPGPGNFDIIFLDPPFAADSLDELCRLLDEAAVLKRGSLIYLEDDRARSELALAPEWQLIKSKTAGNVRYSLVQIND